MISIFTSSFQRTGTGDCYEQQKKSETLTEHRHRSPIKSRILFMTHPGGSNILAGYVSRKVGNAMNAVSC